MTILGRICVRAVQATRLTSVVSQINRTYRSRTSVAWVTKPVSVTTRLPPSVSSGTAFHQKRQFISLSSYKNSCLTEKNLSRTMPEKKAFSRVAQNVVPVNYALRLKPNLKTFTFEGNEDIAVQVKESTKTVVLYSLDIKISEVKYVGQGQAFDGEGIGIAYSEEDERVSFTFPEDLKVGEGQLSLKFTGELNDKMKGFYRSKYTSPDGEERYGAVSQFEATDARRAFPCWDEPAIKATFDVTLVVPEDRTALSNMPVKSETACAESSGYKEVVYERTPVMSTYLLAFVVGHYDFVEGKDEDGIVVRVYTPQGKKEQGQFALEVAVKTLPFYKKYFDIAYPLPKMDLIAIADFAAGAMENWGLVTYRETALLVDPQNSSSTAKQWVALVVGHELAHQWFGNLVTMEWWTHLWLNEGFASWIEYLCVDYCFPEYDIWTQFASSDYTRALDLDALENSHPIEVPVGHPNEVDEIFDLISYSKGASVIRMLHDFLGDEAFRKGMNAYLTQHKYKNTMTEDLWEALGNASGKPVQEIMNTWTKQMGFPLLKVSQTKDGKNRTLKITQQKFCADGKPCGTDSLWQVPISISTASSPDKAIHKLVLNQPETTVTVENVEENDWIKLNTGGIGFYRTYYSLDMLTALIAGVRDGSLPPRDRLGLQNDLFALARAGEASSVDFLQLAEAFVNETNYTVWSDLNSGLSNMSSLLQYTDFHPQYQAFLRKLFTNVADKLGWDPKSGESHLDAMLRGLVIGRLGNSKHEATQTEAANRFQQHVNGTQTLHADLRAPVYRTAVSHGGEEVLESLLKLYKTADLQEEKVRILRSLGGVEEENLINRVLDFCIGNDVRSQDTIFGIAGVTGSVKGRELAWQFLQKNWAMLHERYNGMFLIGRLIQCTTESFVTAERAKEVEAFFKENPAPAAERKVQQSIENINLNCSQLQRDQEALKKFLSSYS